MFDAEWFFTSLEINITTFAPKKKKLNSFSSFEITVKYQRQDYFPNP
jgi:hypothetical protein